MTSGSEFAASARRFATQAAVDRAALFGGAADNATAQADGNNLQIGSRQFRAPFADEFGREIDEHGEKLIVGGVILIRDALALTIEQGTEITHLASGAVYVVETIKRSASAVERRLGVRRLES